MTRGDRITDRRDLGAFVPAALDDYPLTLLEFRLYCRAVRRAGDSGTFYESLGALARAWGVGDRTIREARDLLIAADLLREQVEHDDTGAPVVDEHGLPVPAREPDGRYRLQLTRDSAWCPDTNVADLRLHVAARPEKRPGRRTSPKSGRSDRTRRPAGASAHGQPPAAASGRPDGGSGRSDRTHAPPGPVAGTGGSGRRDRGGPVAGTDEGTPVKVLPEGPPPPPPGAPPSEEEVQDCYRQIRGALDAEHRRQLDEVGRTARAKLRQAIVDRLPGWGDRLAARAVREPLDLPGKPCHNAALLLAARIRDLPEQPPVTAVPARRDPAADRAHAEWLAGYREDVG